jgi:hypothetical protein
MTHSDILNWGREHSFPFLVLDGDEPLRHGELHWQALIRGNDVRRITRVVQRIEAWERIVNTVVEKSV